MMISAENLESTQSIPIFVLVNFCPVLSEFLSWTFDILAKIINENQI